MDADSLLGFLQMLAPSAEFVVETTGEDYRCDKVVIGSDGKIRFVLREDGNDG